MKDNGRLESLRRSLYDPAKRAVRTRRSNLSPAGDELPSGWTGGGSEADHRTARRKFPWLGVLLVAALLFFLSAVSIVAYVFYNGGNLVSPGNVTISTSGPEILSAGETLTFQVLIRNDNAADLKSVDLIAEYPPGTRSAFDPAQSLSRERWSLETIKPGALANQTVRAVVFGETNAEQEIKLTLEYRLSDSNAIFDKSASYHYTISDSPLLIALEAPAEVNSGQDLSLQVEITSKATSPLPALVLAADYPPGFTYERASIPPAFGNNFWRLGELAPGEKKTLTVIGRLEGQDEDSKGFRFSAGVNDASSMVERGEVDSIYGELFQTISIKRPAISLGLSVNGESSNADYVAFGGQLLRVDLTWANNTATEILDGRIEIKILGDGVLDQRTVAVTDGFYQSSENLILWQSQTKPSLGRIAPAASDRVNFTFSPRSLIGAGQSAPRNPQLDLIVNFSGRKIVTGLPDEKVESTLSQRIKLNSDLQLAGSVFYYGGPFRNIGPLPPRVGEETTYAVVWSVINSSNTVREATVRAGLPSYVRWLGATSPSDERISYDEATGEVVWELGVIEAGQGLGSAAREAAFQVAFKPSISQVGESPTLVAVSRLTGIDTFTSEPLQFERRALDIRLLNDAGADSKDGRVAP